MLKKILLIIPIVLFTFLITAFVVEKPMGQKEVTFSPLFQILGKFVQTADASFSRILSGGEWDEKEFGNEIKKGLRKEFPKNKDSKYLNKLIAPFLENSRKDFKYEVFVDQNMPPNAYAMPGGAIVFSGELLDLLENEAQVAAILAHEVGHIELDHCLNAAKFELAKEKYNLDDSDLFPLLYQILIGLSFSKSQEDEADDYAFNSIERNTDYWPLGLSESFGIFLDEYGSEGYMDILDEFFQSHPDMEYRRDKFYERAKGLSQGYEKYIGKKNLEKRKAMSVSEFYMEWKEFSIEE